MQLATAVIVHIHILAGKFLFAQANVDHVVNLAHPLGELFLRVNLHGINNIASDISRTFGGDSTNILRMCMEHWGQG